VVVPFVSVEGSTVGAIAGRFDIVLSVTPSSVPALTLLNSTDPARNPAFHAGDNWRLDLQDASAAAPVYLHFWRDNADLGVSGPYGSATDSNGAWTLSGSFGASEVGSWQLQAVIGSATGTETSAPIALRVSNV